jgi:hypothetical protein
MAPMASLRVQLTGTPAVAVGCQGPFDPGPSLETLPWVRPLSGTRRPSFQILRFDGREAIRLALERPIEAS